MKNKLTRIFGVVLSTTLVASLLLFALPVPASAVAPGDTQWTLQDLPTATGRMMRRGSEVTDIAVGNDGSRMYLADVGVDTIQAEVSAIAGATWASPTTFTVDYVDQDGVGANVSTAFVIPAAAVVGDIVAIVIAPDTGVLDIQSYDITVAVASTAGNFIEINTVNSGVTLATCQDNVVAAYAAAPDFVDGATTGGVSKSTNAGQSWSAIDAYPGVSPLAISVAPDDVDVIAVTDGNDVLTSNNAGVTWSTLPAPGANWVNAIVTDIAVGPARSGTLLGREYFISVADQAAGAVNTAGQQGDVLMIGATAAWASVGATTGIMGTRDYMTVMVSPNFVGDRCVVAVGTAVAAGTTRVEIINTATTTVIRNNVLDAAGATDDYAQTPAVTSIIAADVAVPSDFDPTSSGGQRVFVGIADFGASADNDVYRTSGSSVRALGWERAQVKSVAYAGTIDEGTLFAGQYGASAVLRTADPTVSFPTWKRATSPSGANKTVVRLASDFASSSRVFAGTSGAESALSISENGGANFFHESFIDNGVANNVVAVQDIEVTPDGSQIFAATDDGTDISVWRSDTPVSSKSWSRVYSVAGTAGLLELNPDWATSPTLYFANVAANGSIYVSSNGGRSFSTRNSPTGVTLSALGVEDAQTVYLGDANGNVYTSVNAAWTWSEAVGGKAGAIWSIACPKEDVVIVGGTDKCSYSTNGGDSFTKIATGLAAANYQVCADEDYIANNYIYAGGSNAAANNIYRFEMGTSSEWQSLLNDTPALANNVNQAAALADAPIVSIAYANDVLYGQTATYTYRSINSHAAPGSVSWRYMDVGTAPAAAAFMAVAPGSNLVYAADGVTSMWAYDDYLATAKLQPISPTSDYVISIDPVNGRADPVDLVWEVLGSGTGLVNSIDLSVTEVAVGWTGATTFNDEAVSTSGPTLNVPGDCAFTMRANKEYMWRARVRDVVGGDVIISPWSEARVIVVEPGTMVQQAHAGLVMTGPAGGAQDVSPALVGFAWAPAPGVTEYQIIVATDAGLTNAVGGTPATVTTTSYSVSGLENATTYFWAVKATKPTEGLQNVATFTTMAKAEPAVVVPTPETPQIEVILPAAETPGYIWAVVGIGAILVIAVIILIVRTRRVV